MEKATWILPLLLSIGFTVDAQQPLHYMHSNHFDGGVAILIRCGYKLTASPADASKNKKTN